MKAVVDIKGTQYLVEPGAEITVSRLTDAGPFEFPNVLAVISDSDVQVGTPYLSDQAVHAEKVADLKGEKVRTLKYKAKSRYRKVTGFRPLLTRLKIVTIGDQAAAPSPEPAPKPARKTQKKAAKPASEKKA